MKPKVFVPPAIALVAAGIWLGSQRQSLSTLEEEVLVLRKHIATVAASAETRGEPGAVGASNAATAGTQPIDWKETAAMIMAMQGGTIPDLKETMRLQRRLQEMSKEELAAALDEIAGMDLPAAAKEALEQTLFSPLALKDPELAFSKFASKLAGDNNGLIWAMSNAMSEWLKKDPGSALRWLDREIEAGNFEGKSLDGRNQTRFQLESVAVRSLISSDPDAAIQRVTGLPDDQRRELFSNFGMDTLKESDQVAFAKVVRASLSEKEQVSAIASQASWMVGQNGLGAADAYLERIQASPGERMVVAEQSVSTRVSIISREKQLDSSDIEELRRWSSTHSPDTTDRLTGKILAEASRSYVQNKLELADAVSRVEEYHRTTRNDDVLIGFLESMGRENKETSRTLAEKITDPAKREEWMKRYK